jgi:TonB family protein
MRNSKEEAEKDKIRTTKEEAEKKRLEAEQQRESDIINRTNNAIANSKNTGTNSIKEGTNGGITYNLGGRSILSLPYPKYASESEGRVVVEVSVDPSGKVVQANPGTKGSSTLDGYLLNAAREAALKARFEVKQDAPALQKGTITYNFILK